MSSELTDRLVALTRDLILIPTTDSDPQERARLESWLAAHLLFMQQSRKCWNAPIT